jgi:hypothetical protein
LLTREWALDEQVAFSIGKTDMESFGCLKSVQRPTEGVDNKEPFVHTGQMVSQLRDQVRKDQPQVWGNCQRACWTIPNREEVKRIGTNRKT